MRRLAPELLPILRSRTQAGVLAVTLLNPDQEFTLTDIARRVNAPLSSVHAEVERLERANILQSRTLGHGRLIRAGSSPLVRPLTELTLLAFGPPQVIAEEFADIPNIERIALFGSWAARYHDVAGPEPADIDVAVIMSDGAHADRARVYQAAERAQMRLGRPVNPAIISHRRWSTRDPDDTLLTELTSRPVVEISSSWDLDSKRADDDSLE